MAGYKEWIDNAEVKVDYFSAFLKAWIAFNAWYNEEIHECNDQKNIERISEDSRFKSYITNLLSNENSESKTFKDNLAKLHEALLNSPIKSQEYFGVKQNISFSEIAIKNKKSDEHFDYRNISYKCLRNKGVIITTVQEVKSKKEIFKFEQNEWDIEELKQQSDFNLLSYERKAKCEECYTKMIPYIVASVLNNDASDKNGNMIGAYCFIKDNNKIAEAIIKILYMLRCCLAHGDITPDNETSYVYRYAYEVLLAPLIKLK